jgi:anaerobic selenocysteine-containing dehydrogenase
MENDTDTRDEHQLSRRGLVKGAAGAAAVGAVAIASARTPAQAATASTAGQPATAAAAAVPQQSGHSETDEPIVVHVRDLHTGALDLFVGDRAVSVKDRDLAARIAAAAR